ncbi:nickel transport protein [Seleniivibrio woodruffii]|uniref:Nickel transport protein n=1 Tax=Seleniivibrio woodruffii TaxID=1078050 RepID=A0A4R1KD86_9BACT|nr:hypothetical protein [Seleniivibrio woodruffii]TCK62057.1 nickel transport protein [Seleniivibrio woodruffii]TVZ34826.1 nickel transport protein [Seleniivibrio woodruffii]
MKTKILLAAMLLIGLTSNASAHKLNILGFAENDTLSINAYFADGSPCQECAFQVIGSDGKVFAEGRLDKKGEFFQAGKTPAEMTIIVDAGAGHRGEEKITAAETSEVKAEDEPAAPADNTQLRQMIREELSKQTAELKAEMDKGKSRLDKIIAGIGYILGIFGIAVLVRKR